MAIEIRHLTIKCDVDASQQPASPASNERIEEALHALRRDLLAETDRRIATALRRSRER